MGRSGVRARRVGKRARKGLRPQGILKKEGAAGALHARALARVQALAIALLEELNVLALGLRGRGVGVGRG